MKSKELNMMTIDGKVEYLNTLKDIVKERLAVGQVIPSYKKLCEILGESPKTGNSRKSQMRLWESCFTYKSGEGYKMIITEIQEEPKEIEDDRNGNGGEFMKYTLPLMLGYLAKNNGNVSVTKTQLMKDLYFIDESWNELYNDYEKANVLNKYADDGITMGNIWDLYDAAGASLKRTLDEVINYLGKGNWNAKKKKFVGMNLIRCNVGYVFVRKVLMLKSEIGKYGAEQYEYSFLASIPEDERELYTIRYSHTEATQREADEINITLRDAMTNSGSIAMGDLNGREANFKFLKDFEEAVCNTFDCEYYYEKYHISYLNRQVDDVVKLGNFEELQIEFNEKIALSQSINANKRRIKAVAMINSMCYDNLFLLSNKPVAELNEIMKSDALTKLEKKIIARIRPQYTSLTDKLINDRILVNGTIEDIRDKNGIVFIDENFNILDEPDSNFVDMLLDYEDYEE